MEYVMYVLIAIVCGIVLYDWLAPNKRVVSENPKPDELEVQVVQFPDEVLTLPAGWKFYEVPDISEWTPPMKEIFHLITKDRKSWVKTEFPAGFRYVHKEFDYHIFKESSAIWQCMTQRMVSKWVLYTDNLILWYEAESVVRLAEIYFKVKYHEGLSRLERLKQHKAKRLKTEQEQKQLLIRQQEADKISEYLATLKKG